MATKKRGMGKGFNVLFEENSVDASQGNAVTLPIDDIVPNHDQPRKTFTPEALSELSESIKEHGVLQPLLVRPLLDGSYRLVAGERRYRASRMAGLTEVPVVIKEMSDEEEQIFALIENLQREDLNAIEEAEGIKTLIETFGLTQEQAAQRVGKSRTAITNSLRLLNLPEDIADLVKQGKISMGHARALLSFEDKKEAVKIANMVANNSDSISVRDVERMARTSQKGSEKKPEKRTKKRDKFYDEAELALGNVLSRKVKIFNSKAGSGSIEIEFFSKQDLEKIVNQLGKLED